MLDEVRSYDFIVDWWALGILLYRLLFSIPPFNQEASRDMLLTQISQKEVSFPDKRRFQIEYSDEIVSFIKGLLKPERAYRLGNNRGAQEALEHPFLEGMSG